MKRKTRRGIARQSSHWMMKEAARAEAHQHAGRFHQAAKIYEKLIERKGYQKARKMIPALFNYGVLAHQLCWHDVAIFRLQQVVEAEPGLVEAWYNLGTALQETLRCEEAVAAFQRGLALAPDHVASWVNLGNSKLGLGDLDGAHAAFETALRFNPTEWEAQYNQAHYHLLTGEWRKGWRQYEARWSIPGFQALNGITVDASRPDCPVPWQGEDLSGKTLVVCGEQGWGDDILCLRYAPMLRDLGATVTWALRDDLLRLAAVTVAPDRVISLNRQALPPVDYCVTTMTLHHRLGITVETVPGAAGYLKVAA